MLLYDVKKLNEKRTQGEWENEGGFVYSAETSVVIAAYVADYGDDERIAIEDVNFIAAAPDMANMLVRLAEFEVTEEFVKQCEKTLTHQIKLGSNNTINNYEQLVISQLIAEIENV